MKSKLLAILVLAAACGNACALESILGKVKSVESTLLPDNLSFRLTVGSPSCPAGADLYWTKTATNNKLTFAMLVTALSTGKTIAAHINDGDTTCHVQYMLIVDQ